MDSNWDEILARMTRLGLHEEELTERFILGSGRGGQKLQKTSSCVQLTHRPSGISIKCQESRLRENNRLRARLLLCEKIEKRLEEEKLAHQQEREKRRRQKKGRSRAGQEKVLEAKKRRSDLKKLRKPPNYS